MKPNIAICLIYTTCMIYKLNGIEQ